MPWYSAINTFFSSSKEEKKNSKQILELMSCIGSNIQTNIQTHLRLGCPFNPT